MLISFVIPCYKSQDTIGSVVEEIIQTMVGMNQNFEIILVNDNSPDRVWSVIKNLSQNFNQIKGVSLARNFGQHAALMAGYQLCQGDIIVSLDDDGQTPAKDVHLLLDKINAGYDVVYAKYPQKKHSRFKNIGSWLNDVMLQIILGKPQDLYCSSYFAAKEFIIQEILRYKNPYPYLMGLILRTTQNITNVEVEHRERMVGATNYSLKKLISLWLNGFTAFSVKPLRIATVAGILFSGGGFIYAMWLVIHKLIDPAIPMGWTSTMAAILLVGGLILSVLGLIGEYIGRIYISLNSSPQYVVSDSVNINMLKEKE